jgi:TRAP-type C4-dicarboxylate transport system substrate-binding protein
MWLRNAMVGLTALAAVGGSLGEAAADTIEWRMDVNLVQTRPDAKLLGQFADRVNENAKGRLKINVFYGGSLGIGSADTLRSLKAARSRWPRSTRDISAAMRPTSRSRWCRG